MKQIIVAALLVISGWAFASECPELYAPGLTAPPHTKELCNSFYVVAYDEGGGHPVFSAERLRHGTPVGTIARVNAFKADARLKRNSAYPTNAMYAGTGYDKGHLAPFDDASTDAEGQETFLLSNMTPQQPTLNRLAWKMLEERTRKVFLSSSGDVYVINIPIYPAVPKFMSGVVPIPTGYWKVVIADGQTHTYYADNQVKAQVKEFTGINWQTLIH